MSVLRVFVCHRVVCSLDARLDASGSSAAHLLSARLSLPSCHGTIHRALADATSQTSAWRNPVVDAVAPAIEPRRDVFPLCVL